MKTDAPGYINTMGEVALSRYNEFANFRRNLSVLRSSKPISAEKMSRELNLKVHRINDLECGRTPPRFDELRSIAIYFEVTLDELIYKQAKITFI